MFYIDSTKRDYKADNKLRKYHWGQIRSILLFVIVFIIAPENEKATTIQINFLEIEEKPTKTNPTRDNRIMVRSIRTDIFITAATHIFGGYLPGNFPPVDAAPQERPAARHA